MNDVQRECVPFSNCLAIVRPSLSKEHSQCIEEYNLNYPFRTLRYNRARERQASAWCLPSI